MELVKFTCMALYYVYILCKLTRIFWPNTCLVSMCITDASGAVNKQVYRIRGELWGLPLEAGLVDHCRALG